MESVTVTSEEEDEDGMKNNAKKKSYSDKQSMTQRMRCTAHNRSIE